MMMFALGFISGIVFVFVLCGLLGKRADKGLAKINATIAQLTFWSEQGTRALKEMVTASHAGDIQEVLRASDRFDLAMKRFMEEKDK